MPSSSKKHLACVLVLLPSISPFIFSSTYHNRPNVRKTLPLSVRVDDQPPGPGPRRRKKKKNKYANFSKADKLQKDPLEAMIEESEAKVKELEIDKARKRNKNVPLDEATLKAQREEKRERNKMVFPDLKTIDPYDPTTYGYIELGAITGGHGVHGLVKVSAVTQFPERLCEKGVRHIKAPNRRSPREVQLLEGRHRLGDEYLVKLKGVGDRDEANKLRGCVLFCKATERPKDVAEDEYLIADLIGKPVFLADGYGENKDQDSSSRSKRPAGLGGKFVGTVGGIVLAEDMCAVPGLGHDMIELVLPRGKTASPSWRDELVLLPFVPEIVPTVDLLEGAVYVSPPEGLLDLKYIKEEKVRIKGFLPPAEEKKTDA
mmetsp:Transcript_2951/g.6833  ORF Transcript_2951/g.6833 Transcript_2951/m.6833 type:complete len:374 (+) Transcript_2951:185-1306(+)